MADILGNNTQCLTFPVSPQSPQPNKLHPKWKQHSFIVILICIIQEGSILYVTREKGLIVHHVCFHLDKTEDRGDIEGVANTHRGQTSDLKGADLKSKKQ